MVKTAKCLKRTGAPKAAIRKWLSKTNTASSSTTTTLLGALSTTRCTSDSDCQDEVNESGVKTVGICAEGYCMS